MELCPSLESQQAGAATVEFPAAGLTNILKVSFQDVNGFAKGAEPITVSLSLPPSIDSGNTTSMNSVDKTVDKSVCAMSSVQSIPRTSLAQPEKSEASLPTTTPVLAPTVVGGTGLQIVTRKRSAAAGTLGCLPGSGGDKETPSNNSQAAPNSTGNLPEKKLCEQPAKKKKKYTPKNKKTPVPAANDNPVGNGAANVVTPAPPTKTTQLKSKKSSSSKSKAKKQSPASGKNSKSKKTPQSQQSAPSGNLGGENYQSQCGIGVDNKPPPPPPLQPMPKLTRMPLKPEPTDANLPPEVAMGLVKIKQELPDWDEYGSEVIDEPCMDKNPGNGSTSRKKKSKGRNGNIYIGVFNRIEWMKLQDAFGFTTVNNFGTFVLETMRRVHGDIKFWCDLATASGVYPDLAKYEWKNGFPHAVNREGKVFTPEVDPDLSEEKKADVVELGKRLWEQRLQQLKLQQQLQVGDGEGALQIIPDEVEVDDEDDEPDDAAGLSTYLDTMEKLGCRPYSPPGLIFNADGLQSVGNGMEVKLTEEQIDSIWSEQLTNAQNLERFGEIFNFINSIDQEERGLVQKQLMESMPLDQQDSDTDGNDGMVEIEAAALL